MQKIYLEFGNQRIKPIIWKKNRGRIKSRTCEVIRELDQLENREKWVGLKSIIKISSIVGVGDKKSTKTRLYTSSLESTAEDLNQLYQRTLGIENSLHWTLDVTFNEDRQRKRNGNAAENFAQAQKIALNLIKKKKSTKLSV